MDDKLFSYKDRSIGEWLKKVADGSVGLPTFQRSYVWTEKDKIGDYLTALLQERPTGVFLILETDSGKEFKWRPLRGVDSNSGKIQELILDGQQRMTSLWEAVSGKNKDTYYLRIGDFGNIQLRQSIVEWPKSVRESKEWSNAQEAFAAGVIPLSILIDPDIDDRKRIWEWCRKVYPDKADDARELESTIANQIRRKFLDQRTIHYCTLPAATSREDAINIFVQSNQSSVRVTEFDIAVALATDESEGEEDLRDRIDTFNQQSPVIRHYLRSSATEEGLSELGHWMLMAGCLSHINVAPQKNRFEKLIRNLSETAPAIGSKLDEFLKSVENALEIHADYGALTRSTLPTFPSVHVLAGLDERLRAFCQKNPSRSDRRLVNKLFKTYIWRAFITNRYDVQANDRLYRDFEGLKTCLEKIGKNCQPDLSDLPPIFDNNQHPILDKEALACLDEGKTIGWIKTSSRQGRSIVALTLFLGRAVDWATGRKFTNNWVRDLEIKGALHRHHVFPKALLKENGFSFEQINHGLNGVVLSENSNKSFSKADPHEYLQSLLNEENGPSEKELKCWVESHLVPYDVLMSKDSVESRYRIFIERRAQLVAEKFRTLTQSPV